MKKRYHRKTYIIGGACLTKAAGAFPLYNKYYRKEGQVTY